VGQAKKEVAKAEHDEAKALERKEAQDDEEDKHSFVIEQIQQPKQVLIIGFFSLYIII
jgi:hypothetical protein